MKKVLVPLLLRPNGPEAWVKNAERIKNNLTFENKEIVYYDEDVPRYQSLYAAEANARNRALDKHLKDDHTHVFWIDTDIIENDDDIIEKLLELSTEDVVAPYVYLEDNEVWSYKRFYDTDGFIDRNYNHFSDKQPYINYALGEKLQEVKSVGACYIIPAHIYKKGLRYDPWKTSREGVEHMTLFEQMRDICKVYATPTVEIRHAFLPKYGVNFR
jgi:hypothetical protein